MSLLIYANPSTKPTKRKRKAGATATKAHKARKKGAQPMAKRRSPAQRAATRKMLAANRSRKRHRNPSPRKARARRRYSHAAPARRRRVHRNPGGFSRGILGEFASMDGLMLLGAAAVAPTVVEAASDMVVPIQYRAGWTGLLAKALIAAAGTWALYKYVNRKAGIGFAAGAGGSLIGTAYRTFRAQQVLPAAVTQASPAVADEIAKNPTLYKSLMDSGDFTSLNEYAAAPMSGYVEAPVAGYESLN